MQPDLFSPSHMQIATLRPGQIDIVRRALDPEHYQELVVEIGEMNLEFQQRYPRRLFTHHQHQPWLQEYFTQLIETVRPNCSIQQIFLGLELPGAEFFIHRNHPNIGAVICYSVDDMDQVQFRVVDSQTDQNYFSGIQAEQQNMQYQDWPFEANSAIVIRDSDSLWGFSTHLARNSVKRSVWIYLN